MKEHIVPVSARPTSCCNSFHLTKVTLSWVYVSKMDGAASHLSEHFFLLVGNACQLLNKAVWEVPTQHIGHQQRLLQRASACGKRRQRHHGENKINAFEARWKSSCYGDSDCELKKRNRMYKKIMTDEAQKIVTVCCWLAYRGCVRVPWRTRATWEIHWERMLLRSWLTFGWLHIWGGNREEEMRERTVIGVIKIYVDHSEQTLLTVMNRGSLMSKTSSHFQTYWALKYRLFLCPQDIASTI